VVRPQQPVVDGHTEKSGGPVDWQVAIIKGDCGQFRSVSLTSDHDLLSLVRIKTDPPSFTPVGNLPQVMRDLPGNTLAFGFHFLT
jgi:hypothetical protein